MLVVRERWNSKDKCARRGEEEISDREEEIGGQGAVGKLTRYKHLLGEVEGEEGWETPDLVQVTGPRA